MPRFTSPQQPSEHPSNNLLSVFMETNDAEGFKALAKSNQPPIADRIFWCMEACRFHKSSWIELLNGLGWILEEGSSPMLAIEACKTGNITSLGALMRIGYPIDRKNPMTGSAAIHVAAYQGEVDCLQMLAASGAKIDEPNDRLLTPLLLAVEQNQLDASDALVDLGACWQSSFAGASRSAFETACVEQGQYRHILGWVSRHGSKLANKEWEELAQVALHEVLTECDSTSRQFQEELLSLRERFELSKLVPSPQYSRPLFL